MVGSGEAKSKTPVGPMGQAVAANVRHYRERLGLNRRELADRLDGHGRTMDEAALYRIENNKRRVDVDDLVALAITLEVSPARLLMPTTPADEMPLTPAVRLDSYQAWLWLTSARGPIEYLQQGSSIGDLAQTLERWTADHDPLHSVSVFAQDDQVLDAIAALLKLTATEAKELPSVVPEWVEENSVFGAATPSSTEIHLLSLAVQAQAIAGHEEVDDWLQAIKIARALQSGTNG